MAFEVRGRGEAPVVVEVPHAGTWLEPRAIAASTFPVRAVAHDADLYVDELFSGAASTIVASLSRHVVDLNTEPKAPPSGPTMVMRRSGYGDSWRESALTLEEHQRRLDIYFEPYHHAVADLVAASRARFDSVVLLAAHSYDEVSATVCDDVVISTGEGSTCDPALAETLAEVVGARGHSVAIDRGFLGGYAVGRHAAPEAGIHAVQIELRRALYMDRTTLVRTDGFAATQDLAAALLAAAMEWATRGARG